ncbi:MAG: AbrB/MazE/SpoVT family DNA-binding domain-containing protein [Patescibacteria group bacterium]
MLNTTAMTQKGQVTIPRHIRNILNVQRDSTFLVTLDEVKGRVILEPIKDLLSLAGSLKSNVVLTDEELEKARTAMWASRWK